MQFILTSDLIVLMNDKLLSHNVLDFRITKLNNPNKLLKKYEKLSLFILFICNIYTLFFLEQNSAHWNNCFAF